MPEQPTDTVQAQPVAIEAELPSARELYDQLAAARAEADAQRRAALAALYPVPDSNLLGHAQKELELAGLLRPDADYGGHAAGAVLDLMRVFAGAGPSGGSAMLILDLFARLARFDVLTPLTGHPAEWGLVDSAQAPGERRIWQSTRKPSVFWREGDDTWYDLNDRRES